MNGAGAQFASMFLQQDIVLGDRSEFGDGRDRSFAGPTSCIADDAANSQRDPELDKLVRAAKKFLTKFSVGAKKRLIAVAKSLCWMVLLRKPRPRYRVDAIK